MAALLTWIRNAVDKLSDPNKEERVKSLASRLHRTLQVRGKEFTFAEALRGIECTEGDLTLAKVRVYKELLSKAWSDGSIKPGEQNVLRWVANCLELREAETRQIDLDAARDRFAVALAQAMVDGVVDPSEEIVLSQIASSAGCTVAEFTRTFFRNECEGFLRGIFLACVADGELSAAEWNHLMQTTAKLGITHDEFLQAIHPQAQRFVEHALADAKADGKLSDHEDATLIWLLNNLCLADGFRSYATGEIGLLRTLTNIRRGRLQSIQAPLGIEIRAGEIVYFHTSAILRQIRMLKSGPQQDDHQGTLTLTDNRIMFASVTKSRSVSYRKIVSHRGGPNWIELQIEGKPAETLLLPHTSPVPYALFQAVVAMANQTKVAQVEGNSSRHIPRDVRQRVWQAYGGRCAECNAEDYLEFDHVIPVAKGGSNADGNIQLLCRRCNLKKSDFV